MFRQCVRFVFFMGESVVTSTKVNVLKQEVVTSCGKILMFVHGNCWTLLAIQSLINYLLFRL